MNYEVITVLVMFVLGTLSILGYLLYEYQEFLLQKTEEESSLFDVLEEDFEALRSIARQATQEEEVDILLDIYGLEPDERLSYKDKFFNIEEAI